MSLSDLASLGSFVSGIAVIISLVYLALQVRQAQKNQRALMMQGQTDRVTDILLQLAQPGILSTWDKATHAEELDRLESTQFILIARAYFRTDEEAYAQHRDGLLDAAAYETVTRHIKASMGIPAMRAAWKLVRPSFEPSFRAAMDDWSKTAQRGHPNVYLSSFRSALKDEMSRLV